jgi:molybdopterin converting factor small subunit
MIKIHVEVYGYIADIDGSKKATVEPKEPTVRGLLEEMERTWSRGFMEHVWDKNHELTQYIVVYVNSAPVFHLQGLDTPLADGDKVLFMQPIEGG